MCQRKLIRYSRWSEEKNVSLSIFQPFSTEYWYCLETGKEERTSRRNVVHIHKIGAIWDVDVEKKISRSQICVCNSELFYTFNGSGLPSVCEFCITWCRFYVYYLGSQLSTQSHLRLNDNDSRLPICTYFRKCHTQMKVVFSAWSFSKKQKHKTKWF